MYGLNTFKTDEKTSIWHFGITIWEIFTNCKILPYSEIAVLDNCAFYLTNTKKDDIAYKNHKIRIMTTLYHFLVNGIKLQFHYSIPTEVYQIIVEMTTVVKVNRLEIGSVQKKFEELFDLMCRSGI